MWRKPPRPVSLDHDGVTGRGAGAIRHTISFSISILTLMALIVLPLSSALLWLGWRAVEAQERQRVEQRMSALHDAVSGFIAGSVRVVISAGEVLAQTPEFKIGAGPEGDNERRRQLMALLERHPTLAAAFAGYPTGRVIYVGRTAFFSPAERAEFGVPDDSTFLMRTIDGPAASRRENWWFDSADPDKAEVRTRPSDFDPRVRPWYVEARSRNGSALTDPYRFAWQAGIGISAGVPIPGGGVVGFDFTLGTLARLLNEYRITPGSIIAVGTRTSDVVIESEPCTPRTAGCLPDDGQVRDALQHAAIEVGDDGRRIERTETLNGHDYRMIAQATPPVFGRALTIAAAVPVAELSAASDALLVRAALAGAVAVVIAILAVLAVSLLLSRSMARLAAKTERIRQLDFSDHVPVTSRITEIFRLSAAIERMREGLEVFGLYVSRELVGEIMRAPARTGLGGTRRQLTVMFTDIEGFSRISERIEPELLTSRLSRYFDMLGTAISANQGMIDKYIGDSIMAFWNAPQPDPDHIFHACNAALQASAASRHLADKWRKLGRAAFRTRIGLHTGPAVVGNVGARQRINYTLVGAVANQASRLESLNKVYGTEILASGEVAQATVDRFVWRHVDRVVAAGTTEPLDILEPLGPIEHATSYVAFLAKWQAARTAYADARFEAALNGFREALALKPGDGPCQTYIDRCIQFVRSAPQGDWTAVWRFDRK
jgi:adenylate cyclase